MTLEKMRRAGESIGRGGIGFTNSEVDSAIQALRMVIAFMEGAMYHRHAISPLRLELQTFEGFQQARKNQKTVETKRIKP